MRLWLRRVAEDFTATKEGFVFSAGGPIWGLDWCPYPEQEAAGEFLFVPVLRLMARTEN